MAKIKLGQELDGQKWTLLFAKWLCEFNRMGMFDRKAQHMFSFFPERKH